MKIYVFCFINFIKLMSCYKYNSIRVYSYWCVMWLGRSLLCSTRAWLPKEDLDNETNHNLYVMKLWFYLLGRSESFARFGDEISHSWPPISPFLSKNTGTSRNTKNPQKYDFQREKTRKKGVFCPPTLISYLQTPTKSPETPPPREGRPRCTKMGGGVGF